MKREHKGYKDLIGTRCGHLRVIGDTEKTVGHNAMWLCRCDCGRYVLVKQFDLLSRRAVSCGCRKLLRDKFLTVWLQPEDQDITEALSKVDNAGDYIKSLIRKDSAQK